MNSFADLILSRIRDRLRNAGKRADALSLKERALLAVSLLLVMLYVWNQWFLSPLEVRRTTLLAERASLSEELSRFDALTTEWATAAEFDPDAEGKERIAAITQQLTSLSSAIEERAGRMVPPAQVPEALRQVLTELDGLRFESLEGLPPRAVIADAGAPQALPGASAAYSAYRHSFRIRFTGSYQAITAYVQQLEKLPYGFFWDELSVDASEFPQLRGSLVVYTVSLDRGWIGV